MFNLTAPERFRFAHAPVPVSIDTRNTGVTLAYMRISLELKDDIAAGNTVVVNGSITFTAVSSAPLSGEFQFTENAGRSLADAMASDPVLSRSFAFYYNADSGHVEITAREAGYMPAPTISCAADTDALAAVTVLNYGDDPNTAAPEPGYETWLELWTAPKTSFGCINTESEADFSCRHTLSRKKNKSGLYVFDAGPVLRGSLMPLMPDGSPWQKADTAHKSYFARAGFSRTGYQPGVFYQDKTGLLSLLFGVGEAGGSAEAFVYVSPGVPVRPLCSAGPKLPVYRGQFHPGIALAVSGDPETGFGSVAMVFCSISFFDAEGEMIGLEDMEPWPPDAETCGIMYTGAWTHLLDNYPEARRVSFKVFDDADNDIIIPGSAEFEIPDIELPADSPQFAFLNNYGAFEYMAFPGRNSELLAAYTNFLYRPESFFTGMPPSPMPGPAINGPVSRQVYPQGIFNTAYLNEVSFLRLAELLKSPQLYRVFLNTPAEGSSPVPVYKPCQITNFKYNRTGETNLFALEMGVSNLLPLEALVLA
ncbi:MAG: hypothetical protein V4543_06585 [Bacteroidota bacterium]